MKLIPGAIYKMDPHCRYKYQGKLFRFICWKDGDDNCESHGDEDFPVMQAVEADMVHENGDPIVENGMFASRYKLVQMPGCSSFNSLL